jgi:hypothetical protein
MDQQLELGMYCFQQETCHKINKACPPEKLEGAVRAQQGIVDEAQQEHDWVFSIGLCVKGSGKGMRVHHKLTA